ncbi:MAG TPA: uracil-xanthine permease [Candidatus Limadaptatus stercoripullorum]|uniref:Uracil-xanthine permease n=1 Tax=Candidatus Limadaptatus stercoripullorum TaxID=2840846 RepID=A0A9D1NA60_9FIRM|nr:uracil-xanthine permease [Candidatus Limadaptatus stercoripullorum]
MKLVYDINDKPPVGKLIVLAIQQLLAILAATIAVPTIIGLPAQIPAAILGAGVGTIVYLLFTRFKSPVFLGSSFAFINSLAGAMAFGYLGIIVGAIFAGLVYVIIAVVIHFAGTKWVSKLMPPVIIGPTVALIGLSLAGSAMTDIVKADADAVNGAYNLVGLLCGLVAFFTVVICSGQKRYKTLKLIPFILGIGAGYAVAGIFSAFGYGFEVDYLKIINFDPLINNFVDAAGNFRGVVAFLNYPDFALIEAIKEIASGTSSIEDAVILNGHGVAEVALAFIPVAFVVFAEHIADHKNLGSIIDRDLVEGEPGLKRTLLGDGVGSIAGTVLGICPNTTYGESVGCVAITGNASVRTILVTAIMCIVLSFVTPVMTLLQTIPKAVMGGICLTLYGFIAVSGLKMFKDIDLGENKNLFVVSAILIAGIGGLSIQIPYHISAANVVTEVYVNGVLDTSASATAYAGLVDKSITVTSIATALILGIITYAIMNKIDRSKFGDGAEAEETSGDSLPAAAVSATVPLGAEEQAEKADYECNDEEPACDACAAEEEPATADQTQESPAED